jgi:hypothetical protein
MSREGSHGLKSSQVAEAFERYRDSQALLDHVKNLGDTMAAILQTCSGSGEVCGAPSAELMEQLTGSPVQVYTPFLAA